MSAAISELQVHPEEATDVDVPVMGRRLKGRLSHLGVASQEDASSASEPPKDEADRPSSPPANPKPGSLSQLYLRSVEDRRNSPPPAKAVGFEPGRPQLLMARVDDPGLRLRRRPGGFELSGETSTERGRHDRRLAVAFDGELFAVVIQPGESMTQIIGRLAERLRGRYELEVETSGATTLRVTFSELLAATA